MSDFRAIATVTEALRARLDAEAKAEITSASGTLDAPDTMGKPPLGPTISVFLYQVSPNAALRNADLPSRDSGGTFRQRPRAALDLHYIISCYGTGFEPQFLLGIVVRSLHATPFLTQKEINDAAVHTKSAWGSEVDSVKFVPAMVSLDELSKIWSVFFQTKYALSATYLASVVIVEGSEAAAPALPVRTPHLRVVPTLGPVIDHIASSTPPDVVPKTGRPIVIGDLLHIIGQNLRGDGTQVRIDTQLIPPTTVENDAITLSLNPALGLRAGISAVQVVQSVDFGLPSGMRHAFESNAMPFVLAPSITAISYTAGPLPTPPNPQTGTVSLTVSPAVATGQRMTLMLTDTSGGRLYTFSAVVVTAGAAQDIAVSDVQNGSYLARLQVDGASSQLTVDPSGAYNGPVLNVP